MALVLGVVKVGVGALRLWRYVNGGFEEGRVKGRTAELW